MFMDEKFYAFYIAFFISFIDKFEKETKVKIKKELIFLHVKELALINKYVYKKHQNLIIECCFL